MATKKSSARTRINQPKIIYQSKEFIGFDAFYAHIRAKFGLSEVKSC